MQLKHMRATLSLSVFPLHQMLYLMISAGMDDNHTRCHNDKALENGIRSSAASKAFIPICTKTLTGRYVQPAVQQQQQFLCPQFASCLTSAFSSARWKRSGPDTRHPTQPSIPQKRRSAKSKVYVASSVRILLCFSVAASFARAINRQQCCKRSYNFFILLWLMVKILGWLLCGGLKWW